jgi:hypothetical protein
MLSSCSIQMITGLGILISAYATLGGPSGISAYHWQIAVHLAWFANITPLLGLTFLRRYLQRNPSQRSWRLVVMAVLFILLLVALFPTAYFDWESDGSWSMARAGDFARCFFNVNFVDLSVSSEGVFGATGAPLILNMAVLVSTYTARMVKMSQRAARFLHRNARGKMRKIGGRVIRFTSRGVPTRSPRLDTLRIFLVIQPMASLLLTARLYADFYASTASDIWWAWATAAWVTIRTVKAKTSAQVDEGDLTFGQSMAVLLLIAPTVDAGVTLCQIFPQWIRRNHDEQHQTAADSTSPQHVSETEGAVDPSLDNGSRAPSRQLVVSSPQSGYRRVCYVLELVDQSSKSYAEPWSDAFIVLMWSQTWLTTSAFLYMTRYGYITSSVDFLIYSSIPIVLQPLNCSLLALIGMRKVRLEDQGIGRSGPRRRGFRWIFLNWHEGVVLWTLLVLGCLAGFVLTLPFLMTAWLPFHPIVFLGPWGLYFIYAFIEALVTPIG